MEEPEKRDVAEAEAMIQKLLNSTPQQLGLEEDEARKRMKQKQNDIGRTLLNYSFSNFRFPVPANLRSFELYCSFCGCRIKAFEPVTDYAPGMMLFRKD